MYPISLSLGEMSPRIHDFQSLSQEEHDQANDIIVKTIGGLVGFLAMGIASYHATNAITHSEDMAQIISAVTMGLTLLCFLAGLVYHLSRDEPSKGAAPMPVAKTESKEGAASVDQSGESKASLTFFDRLAFPFKVSPGNQPASPGVSAKREMSPL